MCGIWCSKIKLRSAAARNLSLVVWRSQQIDMFRYAAALDQRGRKNALLNLGNINYDRIFAKVDEELRKPLWGAMLARIRRIQTNDESEYQERVCSSVDTVGTLHHKTRKTQLKRVELRAFRWYCHRVLGLEHSAIPPDDVIAYAGDMWKKAKLNNPSTENALYSNYIRSAKFEEADARDSTYIRYDHNETVAKFGRVMFFWAYNPPGEDETHMAAYIQEIPTLTYRINNNNSFLTVHQLAKRPEREKSSLRYFISLDNICALQAIVYSGGDEYFAERHSCFL